MSSPIADHKQILAALGIAGFPSEAEQVINDAEAMDALARHDGIDTRTMPQTPDAQASNEAPDIAKMIEAAVDAKIASLKSLAEKAIADSGVAIKNSAQAVETSTAASAEVIRAGAAITEMKGMVVKAIAGDPMKSEPNLGDQQKLIEDATKKAVADAMASANGRVPMNVTRSASGLPVYARG